MSTRPSRPTTIYIPKEKSSKTPEQLEVALKDWTAGTLERWLDQRENYAKYDGRGEIWLNRQGNRYTSGVLNYLLRASRSV